MEWRVILIGAVIGAVAAYAKVQMMAKGGFKLT